VARWDDSVQHYRLSLVVPLDLPARLFLCVGCRIQVVLCSHCDRGNRYCGRACWRQVHDVARREAASRYQRSRRGRLQHAARSRRWRQRVADRADSAHKVTHQGSPAGVAAAPLAACTSDITSIATDPPVGAPAPPPLRRCYRCCAAVQADWLRQDFLRRDRHAIARVTGWRHDHSP
jgi:hypothetical protein